MSDQENIQGVLDAVASGAISTPNALAAALERLAVSSATTPASSSVVLPNMTVGDLPMKSFLQRSKFNTRTSTINEIGAGIGIGSGSHD